VTPDERPAPSNAAIEAAARQRQHDTWGRLAMWEQTDEANRQHHREAVASILAAALPLLHAQWAAEAVAALGSPVAVSVLGQAAAMGLSNRDIVYKLAVHLADTLGAKPEETDRG
jgi:hypothetical protein